MHYQTDFKSSQFEVKPEDRMPDYRKALDWAKIHVADFLLKIKNYEEVGEISKW